MNPGADRPSTGQRLVPVPRHMRGRRRAGRHWVVAAASVLVLALVAGLGVGYLRLQNNLTSTNLLQPGEKPHTAAADDNKDPINILVLGTDTRQGQDPSFGSTNDSSGYGNSDVNMLVNISGDRQRISVLSIPRDTMAPFPGCTDPATGAASAPVPVQMINVALKLGGPSCTRKTIQALTGISVEHFIVVNFAAVIGLSNALGGVQVCVNQAIDDPDSGLHLPAGKSLVQGEQALAFLRTRHGFGDGGDLTRIKAQQSFLASLARKLQSEGTLTNIPKVYSIADTATKSITVDTGLSTIPALIQLASRLKTAKPDNITFITAPVEPYPADPNRVQLIPDRAAALFHAIATDQDPRTALSPATAAAPASPAPAATTAAAAQGAPSPGRPPAKPAAAPTLPPDLTGQSASQNTCEDAFTG